MSDIGNAMSEIGNAMSEIGNTISNIGNEVSDIILKGSRRGAESAEEEEGMSDLTLRSPRPPREVFRIILWR
jgi:hypothetical protein